ncbi:NUDIX hydrolase [Paenibacillus glycinis]|uniref:NUDIX domain-containing protein n=1 Tax=Paenibacillus glycinis TaxID=2697035 RepID=A0ABW9XS77_9BACL|nr:NUDIX hydrolase [Paenibacillus glycinis]NBD25522.1 NUDIX domain-containing protein [Paenibacillus glycinis]
MEYYKFLRQYVGNCPLILPGASVIIINAMGHILLQRRTSGYWGLPGGLMELGESLQDTARREVKEETGLDIKAITLLDVFSGTEYFRRMENGDEVYAVTAVYFTSEFEGELSSDNNESVDLRYFPLNGLPVNIGTAYAHFLDSFISRFGSTILFQKSEVTY